MNGEREITEREALLRTCVLFYGRKVDEYVDAKTGARISEWSYGGYIYLISDKPIQRDPRGRGSDHSN